jgi:hypothetical protein
VQRLPQVVDRARERREVEDDVDGLVEIDVLDEVVVDEGEGVVTDVLEVLERARLEVVETENAITLPEQVVAEVGTEEAGSAGDDGRGHGAQKDIRGFGGLRAS